MTEDPTNPATSGDDPLAGRLRDGFDALARAAGDPPPLPDATATPPVRLHPARPVLVTAAVVLAVVALAAAVVLVVVGDDGNEQLRAGQGASSTSPATTATGPAAEDRNTPAAADHGKLMCPPVLLDLSAIDATPVLQPPTDDEAMRSSPWPYEVRWQQDAYTVELSYPYPMRSTMEVPISKRVELDDGRIAELDRRPSPSAHVHPADIGLGPIGCTTYWIRVVTDEEELGTAEPRTQRTPAEETLLDIAEKVHITAPPGSVAVPDVTGLSVIDARDVLARAGLLTSKPWDGEDVGRTVEGQTPPAGTKAAYGTKVAFTLSAPTTTTSPPPPPVVPVDSLPIPTAPLVCPFSRLQVDGDFRSQPKIHHDTTIEWLEPGDFGGTTVMITWPSADYRYEGHGSRELTVQGRPALMHDSGDGQNLVYDTGLAGACRFLEVGVYGGQLASREPRAEALAASKITFAPPPTDAPPAVVGLSVGVAADRLARAGFIPDWGEDRAIGDQPAPVPTATVTGQTVTEPGVVQLTT